MAPTMGPRQSGEHRVHGCYTLYYVKLDGGKVVGGEPVEPRDREIDSSRLGTTKSTVRWTASAGVVLTA